ncbi:MAG: hypothetical protein ACFE0Q_09010 [Anaerolineae bacterium]
MMKLPILLKRIYIILKNLPDRKFRRHFFTYVYQRFIIRNYQYKQQIILTGLPRSGTTLLYNMLTFALPFYSSDPDEYHAKSSLIYDENHLTKNFVDMFHIKQLNEYNIYNKKIIFIIQIRDIRDIITSIHHNVPDDYFIGYANRYSPGGIENVKGGVPPRFIEQGLRDYMAGIATIKSSNYPSIVVNYEDFITNPDDAQLLIENFINQSLQASLSEYHNHPDRIVLKNEEARDQTLVRHTQAITTSRIAKWKNPIHAERIKDQFTHYPELFSLLETLGYETDRAWFDAFIINDNNDQRKSRRDEML